MVLKNHIVCLIYYILSVFKMNKKKISIFIISLYGGGAERVVSLLLNHLKDSFDIYLILLHPIIEYPIPIDQKIIVLDKSPSSNNFINILKIPLLAFRYYKFLSKNNIATSFSFLNRPNFIAGFVKLFGWNGKLIFSERTFTSEYYTNKTFGNRIGRFLVEKLYPNADHIVCNSLKIEEDLKQVFMIHTKCSVIYNPIDLTKIKTFPKIRNVPENKNITLFKFITVGRFNQIKNHKLLIKAASLLKDLDFSIEIIGKGELKEILEDYIVFTDTKDKIKLIDYTSDPFQYLMNADCFVLTSNFEGFPNVVLEALACNLPIISTDCKGGIRELLAPSLATDIPLTTDNIIYAEYGLLVPVGNAEILAAAMSSLHNNVKLRQTYIQNSYNRAKSFDTSRIMNSFRNLLNEE
jgi:N-acetylgalactosamine-N,N'-diacetylbacillosaminyl-diphospho-undecaprenol 4-alpha-N-acetylgalactosaminyltransferase